jgi:cation diffusion facilitator CzcD-associated flavoprotein CzcO
MAIRLKQAGLTDFLVFERAEDLGGTWRDNVYPGCGCDVESYLYSFSFALNPNWTRLFSSQQEIWAYLRRCSRRFKVQSHLCWGHDVQDAWWDDAAQHWRISTTQGDFTATFLIFGAGPLSVPALPDIPGMDRFTGLIFHSAPRPSSLCRASSRGSGSCMCSSARLPGSCRAVIAPSRRASGFFTARSRCSSG